MLFGSKNKKSLSSKVERQKLPTKGLFTKLFSKNQAKQNNYKNDSIRDKKSVYHPHHKVSDDPKVKLKIYKPRNDFNINQTLKPQIESKKKSFIFTKLNINFDFSEFRKKINYLNFQYNLTGRINWLIGRLIMGGIFVILLYLTFFDTFFLIKNYSFTFQEQNSEIITESGTKTVTSKSYLSEAELQQMTRNISNNRFLGLIPNNQFWYLNNRNLLASSQEVIPEITDLEITERIWPNGVQIKLTTEPILATLGLNENGVKKYYRISQLGRIITEDVNGLKEKLISVERRISFNQSNVTFKDYPLAENQSQLNRIWFTITLWQLLESYGLKAVSTNFPSMTDTEVIITTQFGTKMLFESDIELIPREVQENRVKSILSSTILETEKKSQISYIDFRIQNKKVFLCYRGKACDK